MSVANAQRFADALREDKTLLAEVKPVVSGLASFVEAGKARGYDFTVDDAKQLIRSKVGPQALSDEQLDAIGGGDSVTTSSNIAAQQNVAGEIQVTGVGTGVGAVDVAVAGIVALV